MRKTALTLLSVLLSLVLASAGAAIAQPRVGPPPLRVESPTLKPSPGHIWITGYWKWTGINYEWADGRWIKAKPGKVWEPGVWEQVGNHWVWKPGQWVKPKDPKPKEKEPKPGKPHK
jgi:hypothetical protein